MEILMENLDLILTALVILIAAVVFARQGQISLLRELIAGIGDTDASRLYETLPRVTKLLVSAGKVEAISKEARGE